MGYPGVELMWKPGSDNNWVSYYEVFAERRSRSTESPRGRIYFDHSAGADPAAKYEVRTVDGDGNASERISAKGSSGKPALIVDDRSSALTYTGDWERRSGLQPAHDGTISFSKQKGASVEFAFEGRKVLWFSKLGADCGPASVSIDGDPAEVVDTYSADDIWGVCVYRREFPTARRHTIRIEVADDKLVHIDGLRVEE